MAVGLERAFEDHYVALFRLLLLLTGRREVAEDVVQEAFVRSAPRLESLSDGEIRPYLRQAAVNIWRSSLRRRLVEGRARALRSASSAEVSSEEIVVERDAIWTIVQALPSRQRACVVLRYYEDLSVRDIAKVLGCSVGSVKSHTSRAMSKLRSELDHDT